ncbi:hypothetical protein [Sphingobacterium multivorum]|uniref:hypothetical protein n=1 Tax=Sphingobacterium multivorum TaxID=28454 RepID=UPI0031BBBC0E
MKRVLTLLAATCMAVSAYGQAYEFRYNGAADVIFSYPPRGSGGRAFVHDMSNVFTINYEGDFTNGVKIGNSFWVANNGTLNTLSDAGIGTSIIENSEGWNRVKANKHLPEVPSAKQIQADGLDLAEMNLLLLKKVEEMTLQLIQMNNEMKKQSQQIVKQDGEIKSLKVLLRDY